MKLLLRIWCDELERLGGDMQRLASWLRDMWELR